MNLTEGTWSGNLITNNYNNYKNEKVIAIISKANKTVINLIIKSLTINLKKIKMKKLIILFASISLCCSKSDDLVIPENPNWNYVPKDSQYDWENWDYTKEMNRSRELIDVIEFEINSIPMPFTENIEMDNESGRFTINIPFNKRWYGLYCSPDGLFDISKDPYYGIWYEFQLEFDEDEIHGFIPKKYNLTWISDYERYFILDNITINSLNKFNKVYIHIYRVIHLPVDYPL